MLPSVPNSIQQALKRNNLLEYGGSLFKNWMFWLLNLVTLVGYMADSAGVFNLPRWIYFPVLPPVSIVAASYLIWVEQEQRIASLSRADQAARRRFLGEIKDNLSLAEKLDSGREKIEPTKFATSVWDDVRGKARDWMASDVYGSLEEAYRKIQEMNAKVDYILANPTYRNTDQKIFRDSFLSRSTAILNGLRKAKDQLDSL